MTHCPHCGEPLVDCEVEVAGRPPSIWRRGADDAESRIRLPPTGLGFERETLLARWLTGQVCTTCGLLLVKVEDPARLEG